MFFYETRYFALSTSECPFPAKRRGSLNIFREKAGQSRSDSQLEEYNRERVVHQPHLKSRPEKDLGLKGWGGKGRGRRRKLENCAHFWKNPGYAPGARVKPWVDALILVSI